MQLYKVFRVFPATPKHRVHVVTLEVFDDYLAAIEFVKEQTPMDGCVYKIQAMELM